MKSSLNNKNDNKKFDFSKINIDNIVTFCKNNIRYISAGILTVVLVVVLAVTAAQNGKVNDKKEKELQGQTVDATEGYEVNKNKELNKLITKYYKLYAEGKADKLSEIAIPVSDMEKSYIEMMGNHVESYSNIDCYTKKGLEEGSYLVSATFEMKFDGVEGKLPGMDFFYVKANEEGKLYIDNLYSSFNSEMKEQETDAKVAALINKFKEASDVKELQADFQNRYTQAVSADKELQAMVDRVTVGIKEWAASYVGKDNTEEQKKAEEEQKKVEEEQKKAEEEQKKAEEEQKKAEEEQKKAEEEQKKADEEKKKADEQEQQQPEDNSGLNYLPEGKTLTASDAYNVRKSMSETADKVGTVAIGDTIKVILSYEEGWTKVEWNGKTGFIKTELLLNN